MSFTQETQKFYDDILSSNPKYSTPAYRKVLLLTCEALDEYRLAYDAIQQHGHTYEDRFGNPRSRPEVAIVRDTRNSIRQLVKQLEISDDVVASTIPSISSRR